MQRLLVSLITIPVLATVASAQCFEQNFGILAPLAAGQAGYGDDVMFDLQPMNITFPMAGNAASYTHANVCENGVIYLTNGTQTTGSTYAYQPLTYFLGAASEDPRIAPLWYNLESQAVNGGGVWINNTIPGKFVVTWENVNEWAAPIPTFTFQAQLFDNGDVRFFYGPNVHGITVGFGPQFETRCGVTEGNGVADPGSVNLSVGGNSNLVSFALYEEFPLNVFDLQSTSVDIVWAGTGYVQTVGPCAPAFNQNYGVGCYDISDSFYQLLPDSSTAPATLDGQSMVMMPSGTEYVASWGGGTYVTPVAATPLTITDDGEVAQTTSIPFPTPTGSVPDLYVGANGIVSTGANPTALLYIPDEQDFLNSPVLAWSSWHDYNPTEAGSGPITYFEQVVGADTIAYFTWEGVESYSTPLALNPSTLQFQFNLSTGAVTIVWVSIDGDPSSAFGSAHLIGWSPAGPSSDGGSIDLATALPFVTNPSNVNKMTLSASPAPVSSATIGTTVTFTAEEMPAFAPGVYIGLCIASLTQNPGGLDLGFLGAPGCSAYISSIDFPQVLFGTTPTNTADLMLPMGVTLGFEIYSQAIALIVPNSLPNGQNDFGMTVSNGVLSKISDF